MFSSVWQCWPGHIIFLLRKPSYSPFCFKSRCHSNEGRSGKNAIGSIRWPIPENLIQVQKSRKNLLRKPSYSPFCPKFRSDGNHGESGIKLNDTVGLAILKNHTIEPKITTLSYTQPSYDRLKYCLIFPIVAMVIV